MLYRVKEGLLNCGSLIATVIHHSLTSEERRGSLSSCNRGMIVRALRHVICTDGTGLLSAEIHQLLLIQGCLKCGTYFIMLLPLVKLVLLKLLGFREKTLELRIT